MFASHLDEPFNEENANERMANPLHKLCSKGVRHVRRHGIGTAPRTPGHATVLATRQRTASQELDSVLNKEEAFAGTGRQAL